MTIMSANYEYRPGPARNKYGALAKHLQENPGVWALVRTAETEAGAWAAAHQIKTGRRAAFRPEGHYDAYTQGRDIMARYTGGN